MTPSSQNSTGPTSIYPPQPDTSVLRVVCSAADYAPSMLARAVEDCNARLLNLNIIPDVDVAPSLAVEMRVNLRDAAPVVRSLARYGFDAVVLQGGECDDLSDTDTHEMSALERFLSI